MAARTERTDYFKAALWANCLEQAYSDFSREHGKYGKGAVEKKDSGDTKADDESKKDEVNQEIGELRKADERAIRALYGVRPPTVRQ